jgi:hypothetical protein
MSWSALDTLPRTVTFQEVLWDTALDQGIVPSVDGIDNAIAEQITRGINLAYRYAWEFHDWPDAMSMGPLTVSAHPVHGGVFLPRQRATGARLAVVEGIWTAHPLAKPTEAQPVCYRMGQDGWYLDGVTLTADAATVTVHYREDAPRFTAAVWDSTRIYPVGGLCYLPSTGHCYRCTAIAFNFTSPQVPQVPVPAPPSASWVEVPLLYILADAVKAGAGAMFARTEGQYGTAGLLDNAMAHLLEQQILLIQNQNGHTKTYRSQTAHGN